MRPNRMEAKRNETYRNFGVMTHVTTPASERGRKEQGSKCIYDL
jgi:hypothetical protein